MKYILPGPKVIYTKYSKHWPYTVAHTNDCVCIKMLNHGLNHGLSLLLLKLIPCHIHWIVCVLAYLNFTFEFWSSFSAAQNSRLCPDTKVWVSFELFGALYMYVSAWRWKTFSDLFESPTYVKTFSVHNISEN